MKILAFNSSPRKGKGATDVVLDAFLDGARDAGAEIEKIYLHDKKIKRCAGCFTCWVKTPGRCLHRDDMDKILPKMVAADIIVFATPLYHFTMSSSMKTFIERTLPLGQPFLRKKGHLTEHPMRYPECNAKWVVVSVAGFPEIDHFEALDRTFEMIAKNYHTGIAGRIYRPMSGMLYEANHRRFMKDYLDTCYRAGQEVVGKGKIGIITQKKLLKAFIIPKFIYRWAANRKWKREIEKSGCKNNPNS